MGGRGLGSSEGVCHAHVVMSPEQKLNNFKVDKGNYFARCQMCVRTSVWVYVCGAPAMTTGEFVEYLYLVKVYN